MALFDCIGNSNKLFSKEEKEEFPHLTRFFEEKEREREASRLKEKKFEKYSYEWFHAWFDSTCDL